MLNRYLAPAYEAGMPTVRGPVELEVNAVLSTSGVLAVSEAAIVYEPGADARLLGRLPLEIAVADVRGVTRRDGNRRLVIAVDGEEHVFRGVGAQRAWVALTAMSDWARGFHLPPMVFEEDVTHADEVHGLYGFGATGFGYAGRLPIGLVVTFWDSLAALRAIRTVDGHLVVRATGAWTLTGRGAETFARALVGRWLESVAGDLAQDSWRANAAWITDAEVTLGALAFRPAGLVFVSAGGAESLLAPRGSLVVARVDESDASVLRLDADGATHRLRVLDGAATGTALTATVVSPGWRTAEGGFAHQALSDEQLAQLQGLFTSVTISHQGAVIASAGRTMLRPNAYEVEVELDVPSPALVPTALPAPCELQVAGARGRYAVRGIVVLASPRGGASGVQRALFLTRFRGEVYPVNRRESYRLGVDEDVRHLEITVETRRRSLTRDLRFVNVSGGGCRIAASVAPPVGAACVVEIECARKVVSVSGTVVNVSPVDKARWEIGIAYDRESRTSGARIFQDRQTEFLRKRQRT